MKKLQRAAVLFSLLETLKKEGSWCGETNVQKACYFLQELNEVPLGFDFILYKYGPYSFDLADELTALRADSILALQIRDPRYGPSYCPGELGELVKERFPKTISRFEHQVNFVAAKLGSRGVAELERLSTALWVSRQEEVGPGVGERAARLVSLKPHICRAAAEEAVREVDQISAEAIGTSEP